MNFENLQRKYFTIWDGQVISLVTSAVLQMAIIWCVYWCVNRWNRKWTMIVSDMFIASAAGVLAVIALKWDLPIWLIFVILIIRSVGTARTFGMNINNMFVPF